VPFGSKHFLKMQNLRRSRRSTFWDSTLS